MFNGNTPAHVNGNKQITLVLVVVLVVVVVSINIYMFTTILAYWVKTSGNTMAYPRGSSGVEHRLTRWPTGSPQ
jgi:hypothetical protein